MALNADIYIVGGDEYAAEEVGDVALCLQTLYGSETGEQVLDREFGLDADILDLPMSTAAALITQEIIEKTEKYEPRAEVLSVTPTISGDGELTLSIEVTLTPE